MENNDNEIISRQIDNDLESYEIIEFKKKLFNDNNFAKNSIQKFFITSTSQ